MSSAFPCSEASTCARGRTEFRSESEASPSQTCTVWSSVFSERSVPCLTRVITVSLLMPNRTAASPTETRLVPRRSVTVLSPVRRIVSLQSSDLLAPGQEASVGKMFEEYIVKDAGGSPPDHWSLACAWL